MLWALVMAGGWGTRLWPLSNRNCPKPLLKLIPGRDTLLNETIKRLSPLIPPSRIFIIGNAEQLKGLRKSGSRVPWSQIIGEPVARNTAATVALGASMILKRDPQALMLTLPADHWVSNKSGFQKTIRDAARYSDEHEQFCVFGAKPNFPSAAYGYILTGKKLAPSINELKQFVEKPPLGVAKKFVRSGKYLWHAGIFLASAANILASIVRLAPELAHGLSKIKIKNGTVTNPRAFRKLPNISFDYAVLEKIHNATVIKTGFDWCDVGTWGAMEGVWPQDKFKNSLFAKCASLDSSGNVVYSEKKLVFLQGIKDLVIIDSPDALFIGRKDAGEKMRQVVEMISKQSLRAPHSRAWRS